MLPLFIPDIHIYNTQFFLWVREKKIIDDFRSRIGNILLNKSNKNGPGAVQFHAHIYIHVHKCIHSPRVMLELLNWALNQRQDSHSTFTVRSILLVMCNFIRIRVDVSSHISILILNSRLYFDIYFFFSLLFSSYFWNYKIKLLLRKKKWKFKWWKN